MARQRKSTKLHVVEGTYNSTDHADRAGEPEPLNGLIKPKYLNDNERASQIWDEDAPLFWWLGDVDSRLFALYCTLVAEHERDGDRMQTARGTLMRNIGNDLGTGSSRSKYNVSKESNKHDLLD